MVPVPCMIFSQGTKNMPRKRIENSQFGNPSHKKGYFHHGSSTSWGQQCLYFSRHVPNYQTQSRKKEKKIIYRPKISNRMCSMGMHVLPTPFLNPGETKWQKSTEMAHKPSQRSSLPSHCCHMETFWTSICGCVQVGYQVSRAFQKSSLAVGEASSHGFPLLSS